MKTNVGVFKLSSTQAVVEVVHTSTPMVDDPFLFGGIAASTALSELWATGAKPLFAMNIAAFPGGQPGELLEEMIAGGKEVAKQAGVPVLGGHTVESAAPSYGLAVTGSAHPKKLFSVTGAKLGDVLLLTKPLGTGIVANALSLGVAFADTVESALEVMAGLNRKAAVLFASGKFKVNALARVGEGGLLGKLWEMGQGAKSRVRLLLEQVPLIEGVPALAGQGAVSDGATANLEQVAGKVRFPEGLPEDAGLVLADPQINGGLLAAVPARDALKLAHALERSGAFVAIIGELVKGKPGIVVE